MALYKTVNGVRVQMTPQEEAAFEASRAPSLAELKSAVLAKRNTMEQSGFEYAGKVFDSDVYAVLRLVVAGVALDGVQDAQVAWTAKDGSTVQLTAADLRSAMLALVMRVDAIHQNYRSLIAALEAAENPASVDITAGWPA